MDIVHLSVESLERLDYGKTVLSTTALSLSIIKSLTKAVDEGKVGLSEDLV